MGGLIVVRILTDGNSDFAEEFLGMLFLLLPALLLSILMCVACCKCCCGRTEKKYYNQMLAYGILMLLGFSGYLFSEETRDFLFSAVGCLLWLDLALGLWMVILAIIKLCCTLSSEEVDCPL